MSILFSGDTDIGRKRKSNQDSICVHGSEKFFIVADGMGGHNGGDIASQMAVATLKEFIEENKSIGLPDRLTEAVKHANLTIYNHGQKHEELKGMGTTITGAIFNDNNVHLVNVGDSRGYLVRDKKLYQVTRDHSLVQEKLTLGIYDRDGAKKDPQKNILTRTVGFEKDVAVDTYEYEFEPGDLFLFCSDGLHGKVCDKNILEIITNNLDVSDRTSQEKIDQCVQQLIYQANCNGGQDNISAILIYTT